ncbi:MAG: ATP-binding protein, partial [Mycolicibacterium sp.]|nr:ATP-binding protein [Mycolicibacterium sp.]
IAPTILSDRGLDAALSAVGQRTENSGIPTTLNVYLPRRLPEEVESVAYFVVAEALTNVATHAQASQAVVTVRLDDSAQVLYVSVFDDGVGGAEAPAPDDATGLRGLADRVRAARGTFTVSSPATGPTIVTAVLPCAS